MKIVVNRCYGGFGLSQLAYKKLIEWGVPITQNTNIDTKTLQLYTHFKSKLDCSEEYSDHFFGNDENRNHPLLIRLVEELGEEANGRNAKLEIVNIPDDVRWEIDDYDGMETVEEQHRSW